MHFLHLWLSFHPCFFSLLGHYMRRQFTLTISETTATIYQSAPVQKHGSRSRVVLIAWQCGLRHFVSSIILSSSSISRLSPNKTEPVRKPFQNRHKQAAGSAGSQGLFLCLSAQVPSVAFILHFFLFQSTPVSRRGWCTWMCVFVGELDTR